MTGVSGATGIARRLIRQAPLAALVPLLAAMFIDLGPADERRLSAFPLALRLLDPFVWTCALQSTVFAIVVALASLVVGTGLGVLIGRRTFWGRPLLAAIVVSPLAAAPAFLALGARVLVNITGRGVNLVGSGSGSLALESPTAGLSWSLWIWATLPPGAAWVALATARSHERIRPSWGDVARASGIGRFRAWWTLTRPLLRASAFRATAMVFVVALVEPGAPLVLGLRRTLGFQIMSRLAESRPFPSLAIWTAIALGAGVLGAGLIRAWGGRDPITHEDAEPGTTPGRAPVAGALLATLVMLSWGVVAWAPAVGLVAIALDTGPVSSPTPAWTRLIERLLDPTIRVPLENSALLGLGVGVAMLGLALIAGRSLGLRLGNDDRWGWSVSPLVVVVGLLATGWLCELVGPVVPAWASWVVVGVSRGLDPYRHSASVMILGVAWGLGVMVNWRPRWGRSPKGEGAALQAARAVGFGRARARRLTVPPTWGASLALFVAVAAMAAANVTPALLLAPWSDARPLGPAVVAMASGPDQDLACAARLAILSITISALGLVSAGLAERAIEPWRVHGRRPR